MAELDVETVQTNKYQLKEAHFRSILAPDHFFNNGFCLDTDSCIR